MTVTRYDRIGINYTQNRTADIRIVKSLDRLLNLPDGSAIADIGGGIVMDLCTILFIVGLLGATLGVKKPCPVFLQ